MWGSSGSEDGVVKMDLKALEESIWFNEILKINGEEKLKNCTKEAKEGMSSPAWFHGYRCSQTYQIIHFKYVQFIVCQFYLNEIAKKWVDLQQQIAQRWQN